MDAIDLDPNLPACRGADIHDPLRANLAGRHVEDLRPAVELVHEAQDFILLARDHARLTLGRAQTQNVPDIPREIVVEVVQLVERELVIQDILLGHLFQNPRLCATLHDAVAQDTVWNRIHALEVTLVDKVLEPQPFVVLRISIFVSGRH